MNMNSVRTYNVPQKWRVVTGGLCDAAAARRGPLGPCMQPCGETHQRKPLVGFWANSTCGQLGW